MRVFVDIGSHEGQTLEEVTKERWGFEQIHAIEPMPRELALLDRFRSDARVRIHPFALMDYFGTVTMFGTNDLLEASVFSRKNDVDPTVATAVPCYDASEFFRQLPRGQLLVNLNAEGAEIPILDSLIDSGELLRIHHMLISFDIRKVVGSEDEEHRILGAMRGLGFDRFTSSYAERDTHQEQIAAWLEAAMWP